MTSAVVAGMLFVAGLGLIVAAFVRPRVRTGVPIGIGDSLRDLLPTIKEGEEQNLRLAGITPEAYSVQRIAGLVGGIVAGLILAMLLGRGPIGTAVVIAAVTTVGWFLPMLGVRSTAKAARAELDQVIRAWIVLVAQQVSAGVEPAAAMLFGAQMGKRPSWRLLHRFLLAAQQERRPAWEGLVDIVERYGINSLAPVVSALGLAAERGTRLADAVLVAAETLWDDSTSREREAAGRRAQIVVLPATAVALALAGILIYPPFTSLTGGTGVGGA
jgi:Flp pilus assembly protein TadB